MIHEAPARSTIKVLISQQDIKHLQPLVKGLPKKGFIQVDFSKGGYCTSVRPAGLPEQARARLEGIARRYLIKQGVIN